MPKETDRLKLPLPLGNETVTRESINRIFEKIDAGVATREAILISAGSDLNSYITEGEYYCPENATVETLANSPTGVAFHLTIERHAGVVQTLTTFEPGDLQVFQRNYYFGWGSWKKVPTKDDIEEVKVYTDKKVGEIVINDASLTDKGIVQLSNAVDGTREDVAATEKAIKQIYDMASTKQVQLKLANNYAAPDATITLYPEGYSIFYAGGGTDGLGNAWRNSTGSTEAFGYVETVRVGTGGYQIFTEMYSGADTTNRANNKQYKRNKRDSNAFWQPFELVIDEDYLTTIVRNLEESQKWGAL
jgi:hypothetical protein